MQTNENKIKQALTALLNRPGDSFAIIEEVQTQKFVQFSRLSNDSLVFDLPFQTLSSEEINRTKALFKDLKIPGPETHKLYEFPGGPESGEQTSFNVNVGKGVEHGTLLTLSILKDVYRFPDDCELNIIEE